jgi:hypothetical protein
MELVTEEQVHAIRLDVHGEHYVFVYTKRFKHHVLFRLTEWAMNPELSFSWYDAARVSGYIRNW